MHSHFGLLAGKTKTKTKHKQPIHGYLGIERSNLRTRKQNTAAHLALMDCGEKCDILTIFLKICILEYFDWRTYITALCIKRMKHLSLNAEKSHSNGKKLYFFTTTVSFSGRCNIKPMASQNTPELEHPRVWKEGKYTLQTHETSSTKENISGHQSLLPGDEIMSFGALEN